MNNRCILVDADACPVTEIATDIAKKHNIDVLFFIDTSHVLNTSYGETVIVPKGRDAVDIALINRVKQNDIVVTQDYGLAAMVLGKKAMAIHPSGMVYNSDNIDRLLFERHINAKVRRAGGRHKGPPKRTQLDNELFKANLEKLIQL